jgi:hypothetical protein
VSDAKTFFLLVNCTYIDLSLHSIFSFVVKFSNEVSVLGLEGEVNSLVW